MGGFMAQNTIKLGGILLNRHSCMPLAGIQALKTRFPIQDFGNDGFLGMWCGKSL